MSQPPPRDHGPGDHGPDGPRWESAPFDELYRAVGADLDRIPWSDGVPDELMVEWLDRLAGRGGPALVVGCGLGEDAEELGRRGWAVTAFDFSPRAVAWPPRPHPGSTVDYRVADLLHLPAGWRAAHDVVVEINTIQSIPMDARPAAIEAIAGTVAPAGRLFVRCSLRQDDEPVTDRPWPVSRTELRGLERAGLTLLAATEVDRGADRPPLLVADYIRAAG